MKQKLSQAIKNIAQANESYELEETASELFNSPTATSFQLHETLTKGQFKEAQKVYTEEELDFIQNFIDCFINSIS